MHGDDHGVILPPKIAPTQIIIIPIPYKGQTETVNKESAKVATELKNNGFRAEVDLRENITPGSKYFDWELKGVPIRIEIGPRDMEKKEVTVVRRDTLEKQTCKQQELIEFLNRLTEIMTADLKQRAWEWSQQHVYHSEELEEARKLLQKHLGIVEVMWCGNTACGHKLEEITNARVLGTPEDSKAKITGQCIVCGQKANDVVRTAVAY
jgi:prolyl-tRNA synthetase